jgi:tetratricopeptide (TPR) repeat protein
MLTLVLLFASGPAQAQAPAPSPDDQAKVLFANGQRMYAEGRYEEAILAFREAYDLSQRPLLLYNLANAYERLGDLDRAIDALNRYRVYAQPDEQDVLLARVQTMERRRDAAKLAAPAPLPVPQPVAVAPVPDPAPLVPVRRSPAPWVVAVSGGGLAVVGGSVAGITWGSSRSLIEDGDEAGWNRLRPVNNTAGAVGIVGGVVGAVGLTWGLTR